MTKMNEENICRRVLPQSERGVDLHAHKHQETWGEVKKYDLNNIEWTS